MSDERYIAPGLIQIPDFYGLRCRDKEEAYDGKRVAEIRATLGLSQQDLARWLGIHPSNVSRMEQATTKPVAREHLPKLKLIADARTRCRYCWLESVCNQAEFFGIEAPLSHDYILSGTKIVAVRSPRSLSRAAIKANEEARIEAAKTESPNDGLPVYLGPLRLPPFFYGRPLKYCPYCTARLIPALCPNPKCKLPTIGYGEPTPRGCVHCGQPLVGEEAPMEDDLAGLQYLPGGSRHERAVTRFFVLPETYEQWKGSQWA